MGKPTVHDIAKAAGVSLATVDRVLNDRPGVRVRTAERVQEAVRKLGYVRDLSAANLARQRRYRFVFVLPQGPDAFVNALHAAIVEAAEVQIADRMEIGVQRVAPDDPHSLVRTLDALRTDRLDGIALMARETPQVRDAINRLKGRGLAVVALVSDQPQSQRDHFVGINNRAAGRTAGVLMGRFIGPPHGRQVLTIARSMLARDSAERRLGFDAVLAERFPGIEVLPSLETRDDPDRATTIIRTALDRHPHIAGLYALETPGADLLSCLRATGRLQQVVFVAHDLTPQTEMALNSNELDAVITQNIGHLVRSAIRVLRAKCDGLRMIESQERIRIDIVLKENLPH